MLRHEDERDELKVLLAARLVDALGEVTSPSVVGQKLLLMEAREC
jgi:hypothetical protein